MIMNSSTRTIARNIEDVNVGNMVVVPNGIAKTVVKRSVSLTGDYIVLDLQGGSTKYAKRGSSVRVVLV